MDNNQIKFEELFLSCRSVLERFVYYKIQAKSDGDDILQEIAISAYKNMSEIKNPESFKSWILKIAANKCNDFYRKLAKRHEIPFDEITDNIISKSRYGISETQVVRETLSNLPDKDKQILFLYYFKNKPQAEIALILNIPLGTVKSRLYTAKQNFRKNYPVKFSNSFSPKSEISKGENIMKTKPEIKTEAKKFLPDIMPEYKITQSEKPPFNVKWEENIGWFIVPKLGEKITWAMYDFPDRKRTEKCFIEVIGKASVHGIEGVEITAVEQNPMIANQTGDSKTVERRFVAQLTDTHCRLLAESHFENGVKKYRTFLDGDEFLPNWGFGEDNIGKEINLAPKGTIQKNGNAVTCLQDKQLMDVVGRYEVEINGKIYDTVCLIDIELYDTGTLAVSYIDQNGRTVLWRRFNRNDWKIKRYNEYFKREGNWGDMFPENEQITVNGKIYVHWYDCLTDYIF